MKPERQIAIDGPAASGKSTVARLVAQLLGGFTVNTGDMYRAITWVALTHGIDPEVDPEAVARLLDGMDLRYAPGAEGQLELRLNGQAVPQTAIRAPEVSGKVSFVARIGAVRAWLRERQRETRRFGTIVMEGRDIGTVILPDAPFKFYVTASPEVRARRRLAQGGESAPDASVASVAAQIAERDHLDSTRAVAPLKPAADAIVIDTAALTAAEVAARIVAIIRGTTAGQAE